MPRLEAIPTNRSRELGGRHPRDHCKEPAPGAVLLPAGRAHLREAEVLNGDRRGASRLGQVRRAVIAWRRCPSVSLASWCSRSDLWSCEETRACRPRPPAGSAPAAPTFTRMVRGPTRSAGSGRLPPSNQRYAVWGWIPWRRAYSVRSTSADEHIRTGSRGMLSGTSSQPLPRPASRGAGRPHPGAHSGVGGRPAELARRHQLLAWRGPQPPIRAPHPCVTGQPAGRRDRDHPLWGP